MMTTWFFVLIQFSVIACGLVAGVFLAFSDFIMKSLNTAKTTAGVEVMQVINREVFKTVFMVLLIGMTVLSPLLVTYAYYQINGVASVLIMAGGVIYFVGTFVVSIVFNIPMNETLKVKEYTGNDAAMYFKNTYVSRWTFWNAVRALSSCVAATCFLVATVVLVEGRALIGG